MSDGGTKAAQKLYVRLPLPPELVEALRGHVDRGRELVELAQRAGAAVEAFRDRLTSAAEAVDRDVSRVRKASQRAKR